MWPDLTRSAHVVVVWRSSFVSSWEVPSVYIHTSRILYSGDGVSLSMNWSPSCVWRERWALLLAKWHFPDGSQLNSSRYHLVYWTLYFPPVDLSAPTKTFIVLLYLLWGFWGMGLLEILWNWWRSSILLALLCHLVCSIWRLLRVLIFLYSLVAEYLQWPILKELHRFLFQGLGRWGGGKGPGVSSIGCLGLPKGCSY